MGTTFSIPFFPTIFNTQNPKPMAATTSSSPTSNNPITQQPNNPSTQPINPNQDSTETAKEHIKQQTLQQKQEQDEEEDKAECGFCLFMKGGECKQTFIDWEKCVEEGENNGEDIVDKCFEATSALKKCMEANADYYGVILQAEKDAEQEVSNQLDKEKDRVVVDESNSIEKEQKQGQEQV